MQTVLVHGVVAEVALRAGQAVATIAVVVLVQQKVPDAILTVHQVAHLGGQQLLLVGVRGLLVATGTSIASDTARDGLWSVCIVVVRRGTGRGETRMVVDRGGSRVLALDERVGGLVLRCE